MLGWAVFDYYLEEQSGPVRDDALTVEAFAVRVSRVSKRSERVPQHSGNAVPQPSSIGRRGKM
jgi:hypothetical protein